MRTLIMLKSWVLLIQIFNSKNTELSIKNKLEKIAEWIRAFKFVTTSVLKLKKTINEDKRKYSTFYLNSKVETFFHDTDIDSILEKTYSTIMTTIKERAQVGELIQW